MKALLLSPEYTPELSGGVGTYVQELADSLPGAGCEVVVIACSYRRQGTISRPGKTIHLIPPADGNLSSRSIVEGILAFNESLVAYAKKLPPEQRPDVIQCQNWVTFPAGYELSQELQVPLVTSVQYLSEPLERWWGQVPDPEIAMQEERLARRATALLTVSESMRKVIASVHRIDSCRIKAVHNGIDAERFLGSRLPRERREQLRRAVAPNGEKVVFFSGRLNPQKGILPLLDSAAIILRENPAVRFIIAGEPDSKELSALVEERVRANPLLQKQVKLLGKLPRKQLSVLYQAADLAVVPSVYEPFGYAAVEAMAASLPVIATEVGGLAEIVQHERTGILVPVNTDGPQHTIDVNRLAAAQLLLLSDINGARELGRAGAERVRMEFSCAGWARAMAEVYRNAVSNN